MSSLSIGNQIRLSIKRSHRPEKRETLRGTIIYKNRYFLIINTGVYNVSFLNSDFIDEHIILM
ncbi:hypothetical protein [Clostridium sp.]|uniref:hypothetical protein n=1 Tax=Clostridium sp. TaxID=1506 RepID=UPI003464392E